MESGGAFGRLFSGELFAGRGAGSDVGERRAGREKPWDPDAEQSCFERLQHVREIEEGAFVSFREIGKDVFGARRK